MVSSSGNMSLYDSIRYQKQAFRFHGAGGGFLLRAMTYVLFFGRNPKSSLLMGSDGFPHHFGQEYRIDCLISVSNIL